MANDGLILKGFNMTTLQIKRVLALPGVVEASTLYIVRSAEAGLTELFFSNVDGTAVRHILNKADVADMIANATTTGADKLTTARNIAATGDATWDVTFDGSADATSVLTLTETGVVAGEYAVVTVDAKGRVVEGRALTAADIPSIPGTKISSDISVNTSGNAATATSASKLTTARNINGVAFDGTANITINAEDATARVAVSQLGVANGVATLDKAGLVPSSQLPSYVDDVIEAADLASLPEVGESGKIYVTIDNSFVYRWTGSMYLQIPGGVGMSDATTKLATARSISITGDGTFTTSFDGTKDVTGVLTLADSGVVAGEYAVATFDSKGRAIGGRALAQADIPLLDHTTVTSAASVQITSEW